MDNDIFKSFVDGMGWSQPSDQSILTDAEAEVFRNAFVNANTAFTQTMQDALLEGVIDGKACLICTLWWTESMMKIIGAKE